jgi:NADH-quinone oxidoreductase subunit L
VFSHRRRSRQFLGCAETGAPFCDWVFLAEPEAVTLVVWVALLAVVAAALGLLGGWAVYRDWRAEDPLVALGPVYTLLSRKYYLDDIYWNGIIRPIRDNAAAFVNWTNQVVIDGVVNGAARVTRYLSGGIKAFDEEVIDGAVNGLGQTAGFTGGLLRYLQSGNVQRYAAFLFAGGS